MPIDLVSAIDVGGTAVIIGIMALGIFRALQMRRAFVSGIYRSRATWSTFLMGVIIILMLTNYISFPSFGLLSLVGALPVIVFIFSVFAYSDRSVLVAIETDFFHRNTLGWLRLRWPATIVIAIFVIVVVISSTIPNPTDQEQLWLNYIVSFLFFAIPVPLAYAAAALIVGARRSSDRTLRRSILLFGLALTTLVASLTVTSFLDPGTLLYVLVNKGTGVAGTYLIYWSVMALSPLGRVEKEANSTPTRVC